MIRAVRKGAAVQDPDEAAAAVGLARWVQTLPPPERTLWPRLGFALLLAVPLVVTFSVLGRGVSLTGAAAVLLALALAVVHTWWWAPLQHRRRKDRAATAERRNASVASGGGASPSP